MDHVAIDLGGRESQVCIRNERSEIQLQKRIATTEVGAFLADRPAGRVIIETCAEAFAIAARAKKAGHDVRVVPATLVRQLGVGQRGIKTDLRDAQALSEASTRVDLPSVHIPSELSLEMKSCAVMRSTLVKCRTQLVNSVRGWLRKHLIRGVVGAPENFPGSVRRTLAEKKCELPPYVERQLDAIEEMTRQIALADEDVAQIAKTTADCERLMSIPGVGPVTAVHFVAAVDEVGRFPSAHRLESYFGLTPGEASSSDTTHRTGLTKAGSPMVRTLMIQAAWSAFRTRPNDPMVLWAKEKIPNEKSTKNVAIVALARKMVGVMFAVMRDKSTYVPGKASVVRKKAEPASRRRESPSAADILREARGGAPAKTKRKPRSKKTT